MRRRTAGYEKVPTQEPSEHEAFTPKQFERSCTSSIPWKAIVYAAFLFIVGTVLLLCGLFIHTGHVDNEKYNDRLWPLVIIGSLLFIPGSYHVFIAVQTFRGVPGYDFDEFPNFD